ncbi:TatD family hydrolase [Acidobacteriota bacterium]
MKDKKHVIVDSHAHMSMGAFDEDRSEVIHSAFNEGICAILCPIEITEPESIRITKGLRGKFKNIYASGGVHPHKGKEFTAESLTTIENLAKNNMICAVGEIGLDFHYNFSPQDQQVMAFRQQLKLAQNLDLPVIIHSRDASHDVIDCIEKEDYTRGGVLHCFTGDWDFAQKMMDKNFTISFSGIITFPKAHSLREVARKIPLDRLLIETDSPFLSPVPYRGKIKRNEPKFVKDIAQFISEMKNISWPDFSEQTTLNFSSLFGIEISNLRC